MTGLAADSAGMESVDLEDRSTTISSISAGLSFGLSFASIGLVLAVSFWYIQRLLPEAKRATQSESALKDLRVTTEDLRRQLSVTERERDLVQQERDGLTHFDSASAEMPYSLNEENFGRHQRNILRRDELMDRLDQLVSPKLEFESSSDSELELNFNPHFG